MFLFLICKEAAGVTPLPSVGHLDLAPGCRSDSGQLHQCFLLEPSAYLGYAGLAGHGRRSSSQGKSLSIFQANAFVTPANIELAKVSHVAEPTPQWAGEPDAARSRGKSQMYNSVAGGNDGLRIISNLPA